MKHGQISCRIKMTVILKIPRDTWINTHFPIKKAKYRKFMSKKLPFVGSTYIFTIFKLQTWRTETFAEFL